MSKTVEISFFDPRRISPDLLDVNVVVKIEKVLDSDEYIVTFKDGTTKTLPTTFPAAPDEIESAEIVGDDLVIHTTYGQSINVGRIATSATFTDIQPIGTGLLMPGSQTQFKELTSTDPKLTITKTPTDVTVAYTAPAGGGYDAQPGEFDYSQIFIARRIASDQDQIDATRTLWVDDIQSLDEAVWHDYNFNSVKLDTLAKYSNGAFTLDAGQYYLDFILPLYNSVHVELRLQDVTNDVTLLQGTIGRNTTTNIIGSANAALAGDFKLDASADVRVQFLFRTTNKKWLIPFTRRSANTGHTVGGQIFLTKVATLPEAVVSIPLTKPELPADVSALEALAEVNPTGVLSNLGVPSGATLPTHASTQQFAAAVTARNGKVYFLPSGAADIYAYDPATHSVAKLPAPVALYGTNKFGPHAAMDAEGRIYPAPHSHSDFLRIVPQPDGGWLRDPVTDTKDKNILPEFTGNSSGDYTASATINNVDAWKAFDSSALSSWEAELVSYTTDVVVEQSLIGSKTSNTDQGVISSASTINNSTTEAWRALTGAVVFNEGWISSGAGTVANPQWLQVEFQTGYKNVTAITIHNRKVDAGTEGTKLGEPQDFVLECWDEIVNDWVELLTITGRDAGNGGISYYNNLPYNKSVKYRLTVTKTSAGSTYTAIGFIQFHTDVYDSGLSRVPSVMTANVNGNQEVYASSEFDAASAAWLAFSASASTNGWRSKQKGESSLIANNQPANQVYTASGSFSGDYGPWRAFDGIAAERSWISGSSLPTTAQWLAIKFTDGARRVVKYEITNRVLGSDVRAPKDWTFQGKELDSDDWVVIDTVVNNANLAGGAVTTRVLGAPVTYSQYRIVVTAAVSDGASAPTCAISEWKMFDTVTLLPAEIGMKVTDSLLTVTGYEIENKTLVAGETAPKAWTLEGRNSPTDSWVTLHTVTDHTVVANDQKTTFSGLGPWRYKSFRWVISDLNDAEANRITIGRLRLISNQDVDSSDWTSPAMAVSNVPMASLSEQGQTISASSGTEVLKAFDGQIIDSPTAAWLSTAKPTSVAPQWIQIEFASPKNIIGYRLTNRWDTSNPAEIQTPKSWKLQAKKLAADSWIDLQTVTGYVNTEQGAKNAFQLPVGVNLNFFRLLITDVNGAANFVAVGEFELIELPDVEAVLSLSAATPKPIKAIAVIGNGVNRIVSATLECTIDGNPVETQLVAVDNRLDYAVVGNLTELSLKEVRCENPKKSTVTKVELINQVTEEIGKSLLGPGLIEATPQLTITGLAPDSTYGALSKCFVKNRPVGSANYFKGTSTAANFDISLGSAKKIKGLKLTNSTHDQVASYQLYGYNAQNTPVLIAEVDNGSYSDSVAMPAGSSLVAYDPDATTLYDKLQLIVTGGNKFAPPAPPEVAKGNLIKPMTANVDQGQTVSASSNYAASGYEAFRAFGSVPSVEGWVSANGAAVTPAAPQWLQVDLGVKTKFNSINVVNRTYSATAGYASSPKDFQVLGWNDVTEEWDVLLSVTGKPENNPGTQNKYYRVGDFEYQIVRLHITAAYTPASGGPYVGVGKFELFNAPISLISPMYANTDKGQVVTASEQYDGTTPIYSAFGETPSWNGWVSSNRTISAGAPAWIEIDLGKPTNFTSFALSNRGYNTQAGFVGSPNTFQLLGFNETTQSWDTLLSITGRTDNAPSSTTHYPMIGNFTYRRVRLNITARNATTSGSYVCVGRIDLYKGAVPGGSVAIQSLELITDEPTDDSLPNGYVESVAAFAANGTATAKYNSAVYDPITNKVLYAPLSFATFGLLDVAKKTVTQETFGLTMAGASKMVAGVYSPANKYIYFAPGSTQGFVVIVDLKEMRSKVVTVSRTTAPASSVIWNDIFLGADGRLYFSPMYGPEWLVIEPKSNVHWFEYFGEAGGAANMAKGNHGAYGADGCYYTPDLTAAVNYLGVDTLRTKKKRLVDAIINKLSVAAFSDKYGNVYFLNGVASAEIVKLGFDKVEPVAEGIFTKRVR